MREQEATTQCHSRVGAAQLAVMVEDATLMGLKGKELSLRALLLRALLLRSTGIFFARFGDCLEPGVRPLFSFAPFGRKLTSAALYFL